MTSLLDIVIRLVMSQWLTEIEFLYIFLKIKSVHSTENDVIPHVTQDTSVQKT